MLHVSLQHKCEKYWNDDLEKPYDAGRGFSAVTTGYRTFADYEVRDITVRNVSYNSIAQTLSINTAIHMALLF